jgi:threonine synthase
VYGIGYRFEANYPEGGNGMNKFWLTCTRCAMKYAFDLRAKCNCGGTLLVEYDLEKAAHTLTAHQLQTRMSTMWRYRELLPIRNQAAIVSLGEGWTPLIRLQEWERKLPLKQLWVKREEQNPTGSFKARGFSAATSLLHERGIKKVTVPSNGNAASALAAYAGRSGMQAFVFVPKDCPSMIVEECILYGASTYQVDGFIHDCSKIIEDGKDEQGWFNVGTLREPGRVEGKKTMGLELAEQLHWKMPDVVIYPTGGGSGIIGLWKAFRELKAMQMVMGELPRLISVQEEGCQPIVDAMHGGISTKQADADIQSSPTGLRVPNPPDEWLIVSILQETNGEAVAVSREEIRDAQLTMGAQGISASPEGAATWAGLIRLCEQGSIRPQDTVVLFNTSHALKYSSNQGTHGGPIIRNYADFKRIQPQ